MQKKFGENLKSLRKALGLTQPKFAKILRISAAYISSIERGKKDKPSEPIIHSIVTKFNVNRQWLETGQGEMFLRPVSVAEHGSEYDLHGGYDGRPLEKEWSLAKKAMDVLLSGTEYAAALESNINAFYQAVKAREAAGRKIEDLENKCDRLASQVEDLARELKREKNTTVSCASPPAKAQGDDIKSET